MTSTDSKQIIKALAAKASHSTLNAVATKLYGSDKDNCMLQLLEIFLYTACAPADAGTFIEMYTSLNSEEIEYLSKICGLLVNAEHMPILTMYKYMGGEERELLNDEILGKVQEIVEFDPDCEISIEIPESLAEHNDTIKEFLFKLENSSVDCMKLARGLCDIAYEEMSVAYELIECIFDGYAENLFGELTAEKFKNFVRLCEHSQIEIFEWFIATILRNKPSEAISPVLYNKRHSPNASKFSLPELMQVKKTPVFFLADNETPWSSDDTTEQTILNFIAMGSKPVIFADDLKSKVTTSKAKSTATINHSTKGKLDNIVYQKWGNMTKEERDNYGDNMVNYRKHIEDSGELEKLVMEERKTRDSSRPKANSTKKVKETDSIELSDLKIPPEINNIFKGAGSTLSFELNLENGGHYIAKTGTLTKSKFINSAQKIMREIFEIKTLDATMLRIAGKYVLVDEDIETEQPNGKMKKIKSKRIQNNTPVGEDRAGCETFYIGYDFSAIMNYKSCKEYLTKFESEDEIEIMKNIMYIAIVRWLLCVTGMSLSSLYINPTNNSEIVSLWESCVIDAKCFGNLLSSATIKIIPEVLDHAMARVHSAARKNQELFSKLVEESFGIDQGSVMKGRLEKMETILKKEIDLKRSTLKSEN